MGKVIQYTSGLAHGFFVVDESVIAVDSGSDVGEEVFIRICEKCGISPKDVKLIVPTHGHGDHFLNMDCMRRVSGAPILCHKLSAIPMKECAYPDIKPRNSAGRAMAAAGKLDSYDWEQFPVIPDIETEGEVDLKPWGVSGKLIETPGHMAGSYSVVLDWGEAIVGDNLVRNPYTLKCDLAYFAEDPLDGENLIAGLEKIAACSDTVYCGHGGPYTKAELLEALKLGTEEFYRDREAGLLEPR